MEDGRIGASGQSVEVDVDRVCRTGIDLAPTQDPSTVGEIVLGKQRRLANVTLNGLARVSGQNDQILP